MIVLYFLRFRVISGRKKQEKVEINNKKQFISA
jgi:hypothetical protein